MMGLDAKLRSAAADNKASGSSSRLGVQSSDKVFDPKKRGAWAKKQLDGETGGMRGAAGEDYRRG